MIKKVDKIFCLFLVSIIRIYLYSQLHVIPEDVEQTSEEVFIVQNETLLAERIQSQLQDTLDNYIDNKLFFVSVKVDLEKIPPKKSTREEPVEELVLPGLPSPIKEEIQDDRQSKSFIAESGLSAGSVRVKNLKVVVFLDEEKTTPTDEEFIKTLVENSNVINKLRGDFVEVQRIKFPPPPDIRTALEKGDTKLSELVKEIYPYLYYGSIIMLILIFVLILLQVISLLKSKHDRDMLKLTASLGMSGGKHLLEGKSISSEKLHSLPQAELSPLPSLSTTVVQDKKDFFNELRQLMITAVVTNPENSAEIFNRWIDVSGDNAIYEVASFMKATDPKLLELLSEYIPSDIISKIEFAIKQIVSIDPQGIIELFERFRKEFQKKQEVKSLTGASSDFFHFLRQLEPHQVLNVVKDEPSWVVAMVLAQLSPEIANSILMEFPEDKRNEIFLELGKIKKIPLTLYREVAEKITKKVTQVEKIKYVTTDGVEALIKLLEESSPDVEEQILLNIAARDIELANTIKRMYVTFTELAELPDKILAEILRDFDRDVIVKSLVGAEPSLKQKILNNLPPRTRIIVEDTVKTLEDEGSVSTQEVYNARKIITRKIREMIKSGKLNIEKYRYK